MPLAVVLLLLTVLVASQWNDHGNGIPESIQQSQGTLYDRDEALQTRSFQSLKDAEKEEPYPMYCENTNDNRFFNRCFRQFPPGFGTILGNFIKSYINPITLAITTVSLIMVLPFLIYGNGSSFTTEVGIKYRSTLFVVLNFLHRLSIVLVLDTALYAMPGFRQHRPCLCSTPSGKLVQFGSIYGLPSGDAMTGAILGMFIFDHAPVNIYASRSVGFLVILAACFERVILGYHSIAQVTIGASLGIVYYFYSTRAPQFMIYFDAVVTWIISFSFLYSDPALVYPKYDQFNLTSWVFGGFGFQLFTLVIMTRFYYLYGHTAALTMKEEESMVEARQSPSIAKFQWFHAYKYSYKTYIARVWIAPSTAEDSFASSAEERLLSSPGSSSQHGNKHNMDKGSFDQISIHRAKTRFSMFRSRSFRESDYIWHWIAMIPLVAFNLLSGAIAQQNLFPKN